MGDAVVVVVVAAGEACREGQVFGLFQPLELSPCRLV